MSVDFTPDPELYPFASRWFDSMRGRMHHIDEGSGPPILLCHGNPTWSFQRGDAIRDPATQFLRRAADPRRQWRTTARCSPARTTGGRGPDAHGDPGRPTAAGTARDRVPTTLGTKPALLVWGMKDLAFRPGPTIPRMRATFPDHVLVELPNAKHFIQEDAPDRIAEAITERFG